ncbi:MAG: 50S ribosomal protein L5 [Myxococcales bacterium]|nr:50S ribosomal protein L5 [Myxococcales bacterium]
MADDKKKEGAKAAKPAAPAAGNKGAAKPAAGRRSADKTSKSETAPGPEIQRTEPPRVKSLYDKEVIAKLQKEFGYKNPNQVPKLVKITLNMGLGEAIGNPKVIDSAIEELRLVSGQSPVVTKAKKSIATFKLREGQKIGAMVTLRREKMWEFFDRFVSFALPRVRDFKGVSPRAFDGRGNYSVGIREQIIFPEINYDKIDKIKGLNISIVTTARTDEEGRALLRYLGMPFRS